ncbi:MAG: hypothetical protein LLG24_06580, partial [Actinomycetia bacterium]|nr:hypothetical protein [Actinomycetes bacterium]
MRRRSVIALIIAGILAVTLLHTPTASAGSEYRQGVPGRPFALSDSTGIRVDDTTGDPALVPSTAILWQYSFHMLDPRSIQVLSNGNILYASRDGNCVTEVTRDKRVVWSFTNADYRSVFATTAAMLPFDADRTAAGTTIITLRDGRPVFEVDRNKHLIWQYGNGTIGLEPGQLYDGYSASRLANGNTLIADNHGARVIEVKTSDYDPHAPNMGYDESSIVWSLGKKGENGEPLYAADHGYAEGYLDWPRTAQRVGANTLITDQTGQRVIEVQPSGHVVWQYGTTGVQSQAPNCLFDPSGALRAPDGTTFIVDGKDIGRVLRVGADGRLLSVYPDPDDTPPNGALYEPRAITLSKTGSLYIADEGHDRIIEVGRPTSAKATSREIDCGLPGVKKRFLGLDWDGDTGNGGRVTLFYSIDGGPWKTAGSAARNTLPDDAVGVTIRYRV